MKAIRIWLQSRQIKIQKSTISSTENSWKRLIHTKNYLVFSSQRQNLEACFQTKLSNFDLSNFQFWLYLKLWKLGSFVKTLQKNYQIFSVFIPSIILSIKVFGIFEFYDQLFASIEWWIWLSWKSTVIP